MVSEAEINVIAFTGHRPDKIGGYDVPNPTSLKICNKIEQQLIQIKPTLVLSGMALGVDTWAAWISVGLGIPFIAVIPFKGFESRWNDKAKAAFYELLSLSAGVKYVSEPGYAPWKMQKRNEWLVDNCDAIIGIHNGTLGGTHNCLRYAERKEKLIIRINPNDD
jgi:uncharacterized phage-like protein YoqJ